MVKLVYTLDSKSCELTLVRVQVPPRPPSKKTPLGVFLLGGVGGGLERECQWHSPQQSNLLEYECLDASFGLGVFLLGGVGGGLERECQGYSPQ